MRIKVSILITIAVLSSTINIIMNPVSYYVRFEKLSNASIVWNKVQYEMNDFDIIKNYSFSHFMITSSSKENEFDANKTVQERSMLSPASTKDFGTGIELDGNLMQNKADTSRKSIVVEDSIKGFLKYIIIPGGLLLLIGIWLNFFIERIGRNKKRENK